MQRGAFRGRSRQQGLVVLVYAVGVLAVLGMAGVALDLGLGYVTKTKLQNAVDAAALDGAVELMENGDFGNAQAAALATLGDNVTLPGGAVVTVHRSVTQSPFAAADGDPDARFVEVAVTGFNVPTYLTKVLGVGPSFEINASAVAGPQPVSSPCGGVPIAMCGVDDGDHDCGDGSCYGITADATTGEVLLKGDGGKLGPGNYGLVDTGSGASAVRTGMAGGTACFTVGGNVDTEPGVASGPVEGINTRFNEYAAGLTADDYPPDRIVAYTPMSATPAPPSPDYEAYQALLAEGGGLGNGRPNRRVFFAAVVDCSSQPNGKATLKVLGTACVFMTRKVEDSGTFKNNLYGQLISHCRAASGTPDPDPEEGGGGPASIRLFSSTAAG